MKGRSYSDHSPPLRHLNHLADLDQAPVTIPAAAEVPVLALIFVQPVTSLAGVTLPAWLLYVRASRRGIVSVGIRQLPESTTISGGRTQKLLPYPPAQGFRSSAPSPIELTCKGFRPFRG